MGTKINYNELMNKLEWVGETNTPLPSLKGRYTEYAFESDSSKFNCILFYIPTEFIVDDFFIKQEYDGPIYITRENGDEVYEVKTIEEYNDALMSMNQEYVKEAQAMLREAMNCVGEYRLKGLEPMPIGLTSEHYEDWMEMHRSGFRDDSEIISASRDDNGTLSINRKRGDEIDYTVYTYNTNEKQ